MVWTRAASVSIAVVAAGVVLVSGGSSGDPRTPAALLGEPAPLLGTTVVGSGGLTAAVDAYGDVVDLRAPGPAGRGSIDNPAARQAAGTVSPDTGVVTRVAVGDGAALPFWRADWVRQRYLPGTNVVRTVARFGTARVEITTAVAGKRIERCVHTVGQTARRVKIETSLDLSSGTRVGCRGAGRLATRRSGAADRRWLAGARPLSSGAPPWARRMYARSLLVLRALTDRHTGAVAAGARDGWAYVWPRDAATAALALSAAGYQSEARRIARFLLGLDLDGAARFHGDGTPVDGREAQGDAWGWVAAAARATGLPPPPGRPTWRNRPDYQEKAPADYLANAIASSTPVDGPKTSLSGGEAAHRPGGGGGLVRRLGDYGSGWDSAAAWAVRPFGLTALYPAVRTSLQRALGRESRFGLVPSQDWTGDDPWTAPTAWTAWSLAALGERRQALRLMDDLRRAATPAGLLPERVDARTGIPTSTTPLAWSHAFAILALRQLWSRTASTSLPAGQRS